MNTKELRLGLHKFKRESIITKDAETKLEKIKVLLVEDHEATLKGLKMQLTEEPDLEVIGTASSKGDALKLAKEYSPHVILLDLHLPDSSGPKTLSETFCNLKSARVLVFSGETRPAIMQIVMQAGVDGYLLKSEPLSKIAEAIRAVHHGQTPVISTELTRQNQPHLTSAERHLLTLLARGLKYQEIGAQRQTAPETVRKQVDALISKLDLDGRESLIAWAVDSGFGKLESD